MGRSPNEHFFFSRNQGIENNWEDIPWHPIPSRVKWWYSAVYNVTAIVGVGVLSLPYAMSQLGWGPGVTVLILSWMMTFYTLWQMVEMHEREDGTRFDRFYELGQNVLGDKVGLYVVLPQQLIAQFGGNVVYTVTGGKCLQKFHDLVCPHSKKIKLTYWILIFSSPHFVLSHLPDMYSIRSLSLAAAVMAFSYCTITWATVAGYGVQPGAQYGHRSDKTAANVFHIFSALGSIAFAYGGHNVVMEIQATIPSPSKQLMRKGVVFGYVIVGLCYIPVAIVGYRIFGNSVENNILISLNKPVWLIAGANLFVVIHLIGGVQIYCVPVFDLIERLFKYKFGFKPSKRLSFVLRNIYVAFTVFFAITMPFFEGLLGFFGGYAFVPTSYFLPCIMWLVLYKPQKFSFSWWTNWICVVLGFGLMIAATVGGLRQIIVEAKTYKFYS